MTAMLPPVGSIRFYELRKPFETVVGQLGRYA